MGEKTLIARGLFGLRTIQQFRTEAFRIRHFGDRLLGRFRLDCVRVEFASGRSVLVPLIDEGFESSRATVLDTLMPGDVLYVLPEIQRLVEAAREGRLSERAIDNQLTGLSREMIVGINDLLDAILLRPATP